MVSYDPRVVIYPITLCSSPKLLSSEADLVVPTLGSTRFNQSTLAPSAASREGAAVEFELDPSSLPGEDSSMLRRRGLRSRLEWSQPQELRL